MVGIGPTDLRLVARQAKLLEKRKHLLAWERRGRAPVKLGSG